MNKISKTYITSLHVDVPIQLQQMILYTLVSSAVGHLCQYKGSMNMYNTGLN